jgi:prefoldin alpha subunit
MSKKPGEKARVVSIDELLARAEQLKQYISSVESQLTQLTSQLTELQLAASTLENIPDDGGDALVVVDRLSTVFIPASIPTGWQDNVIVNIGLNYYLKVDREKAKEVISKRINSTRRVLDALRKQYESLTTEYNSLQQILAQIYVQARQQAKGRAAGG